MSAISRSPTCVSRRAYEFGRKLDTSHDYKDANQGTRKLFDTIDSILPQTLCF